MSLAGSLGSVFMPSVLFRCLLPNPCFSASTIPSFLCTAPALPALQSCPGPLLAFCVASVCPASHPSSVPARLCRSPALIRVKLRSVPLSLALPQSHPPAAVPRWNITLKKQLRRAEQGAKDRSPKWTEGKVHEKTRKCLHHFSGFKLEKQGSIQQNFI